MFTRIATPGSSHLRYGFLYGKEPCLFADSRFKLLSCSRAGEKCLRKIRFRCPLILLGRLKHNGGMEEYILPASVPVMNQKTQQMVTTVQMPASVPP